MKILPVLAGGTLVVAALVSCRSGGAVVRDGVPFRAANLSVQGRDRVYLDGDVLRVTLSAEGEDGANRFVWWRHGSPQVVDQGACLTWDQWTDPFFQPGVALRITNTHAVTVTRSVFNNDFSRVNVHTWDLNQLPDDRATEVASLPLAALGGTGPYRLCAEAVDDIVRFRVWEPDGPEPGWDDPGAAGAVEIPTEWHVPGHAGWYTGHLQPGASVTYTYLTTEDR